MVFPIAGGTQDTGYEISNSLRFNDDDSAYLSRTPSSAGNRRTYTISTWVKRSNLSSVQGIFCAKQTKDDTTALVFETGDTLLFTDRPSDNRNIDLRTDRLFRDPSAWYHLVIAVDTTQGTDSNRVKIYVNGVQETSFSTSSYPSQNYETAYWNNTNEHRIGMFQDNSALHYDGYISEFNFIDGSALDPTDFGKTNDNGVWIPKKYTSSYGTNGFFLEFQQTGTSQNSSGIGADTSGQDNHFAVSNLAAIDITTDTPTNNFNTLNSLANAGGATLSEGNTKCVGAAASDKNTFSTFGLTKGKWYFEIKVTDQGARGTIFISDTEHNSYTGTNYAGHQTWDGVSYTSATANSNVGSGASDNDIICVAADLDNGQVWYAKNGNIDTSGTANITGLPTTTTYRISQSESGNPNSTMEHNYGNPPFSISSGNADANGYGNFEYAVPSGYYSLCTKNLAEYG